MKTFLLIVSSSLLLLGLGGCATQLEQPSALRTKTGSAGGVRILSVRLLPNDNGMQVCGTVEREAGYYGTRFRHLDLVVLGLDGKVLVEQAVNFSMNPIPYSRLLPGRASYSFQLASVPPPHSSIRVTVDCTALTACKLAGVRR